MKQIVAIQQCQSYETGKVTESLKTAIDIAGGLDLRGKRVLLKPNILRDSPARTAVTTHPEFVRAAIRVCMASGAEKIMVGDSPGVHGPGFKGTISGIRQVVKEEGAEWVDFSGPKCRVSVPSPHYKEREFLLSGVLRQTDIVISLPKLKTHQLMGYTGAMKNLFGLVPGYAKASFHVKYSSRDDMGKMIVDLVRAVKPHYSFMDGIIAMEGPGPGNGRPRFVGLVAVSRSPLALDMVVSSLIGYKQNDIPTNVYGLGHLDGIESAEDIEVRGTPLELVRPAEFKRIIGNRSGILLRVLLHFKFIRLIVTSLRPKPVFDHRKCILCGECVAICASHALSLRKQGDTRKIVIHYPSCIRCYCCHEVCPADAISII